MAKLPRITVVTPSFNQAEFLERTILSVLNQNYPNLEYIIIDGGSTDGSVDIIRQYEDKLAFWVSEPDRGQTDAINKGLRRATGKWIAWQNSDDIYYPGVFEDLATVVEDNPQVGLVIGDMMLIDENDIQLRDIRYVTPSYKALLAEGMLLANQAAFWKREVQEKVGLINESLQCSFDYEWFLRLTNETVGLHVSKVWGALRLHSETKTSLQTDLFQKENQKILAGREMSSLQKMLYKLRRLFLMLAQGRLGYIIRGLWRRSLGQGGAT